MELRKDPTKPLSVYFSHDTFYKYRHEQCSWLVFLTLSVDSTNILVGSVDFLAILQQLTSGLIVDPCVIT